MPKQWSNSLKPHQQTVKKLTFAVNYKTRYRVVIPANPKDSEKKAAAIISTRFEQISGAEFPVVEENTAFKHSGYEISIGSTRLFRKAQITPKNLGKEGYSISVKGNTLFIYGGGLRGVINGAYSLLEEDLGCRWYSQISDDVPTMSNLTFSPAERSFVPKLDIRDPFYFEAWDTNWSLRNKTNAPYASIPKGWGGNSRYALFVHTFWHFFSPDEQFKDHPEYFAEVNGKRQPTQLCTTNPDVIKGTIEKCRETLKADPEATLISISPNDGRGYCECANCSAIDKAEGSKSGTLLKFTNTIADALKAEFPQVTFITLAYLDTFYPPKNIRPHDNVAIQLCTDSHAWRFQFCYVTESKDFQSAMKAWAAIGAKVYIWDYTCDFVHYLVPMANMPVLQKNIQFYVANNARGIMLQGDYMADGSDMVDMRAWVWAKQLWNPNLETKSLMKDFIYGYYKESATPIWKYNMMIWNFWEKYHKIPHKCGEPSDNPLLKNLMCSYDPDGPMFTREFMRKAWSYMLQAEKSAKSDEIRRRVRKIKSNILYLKLAQGIGYFTQFGEFTKGKDLALTPRRHLNNKDMYAKLYTEMMDICKESNIKALSEQNDMSKITEKWNAILTVTPLPSVGLSNVWLFVTDPKDVGQKENWQNDQKRYDAIKKDEFGAGAATTGIQPDGSAIIRSDKGCGWEAQGFPGYVGVGWYYQTFTLPKEFANAKHLYLAFGGVDEEGWIYINGQLAYERSIASTKQSAAQLWNQPLSFDAKPFLKTYSPNQIAVRVYNCAAMGGVYQPAVLYAVDKEYTTSELRAWD